MDLEVSEITRVAGHIGLNIILGKEHVKARLVKNEFRGFESLLRNRLLEEAPLYTSRICGICQVSHVLASVEAIEDGLGIIVTWEAQKLREIANLASMVQSHLLHLFLFLSSDLKEDTQICPSNPMNVFRSIITGRGVAQKIVQEICGRSIHPITIVPGGFSKNISAEQISNIYKLGEILYKNLNEIEKEVESILERERKERSVHLKTGYMYTLEGRIVVKDHDGKELLSFRKNEYEKNIGEVEAEEGFGTYPYLKKNSFREITFRVGPLARLNYMYERDSKIAWEGIRHESVMYTYGRILESKLAARKIIESSAELKEEIRASPAELRLREGEGFGSIEAPRGTLLHHYSFNKEGIIIKANIITPTALNSSAIERDIEENLKTMHSKDVEKLKERAVKVVRDYDPCIPCATHLVKIKFN